jgi:hypothetical protein
LNSKPENTPNSTETTQGKVCFELLFSPFFFFKESAVVLDMFSPPELLNFIERRLPNLVGKLGWILEQEIDGKTFNELNESELKEVGVSQLGVRKSLLHLQKEPVTNSLS